MALLGSFIDSRTIASIASNGSTAFAHGLPAAPDFVIAIPLGAATTASGSSIAFPRVTSDATNVSVFGTGVDNTAVFRMISVVAHSIIR